MEETNLEQAPLEPEKSQEQGGENESESRILEFFEYREGIQKPNQNEKLTLLYELTKIDKELAEIDEEKGDLPEKIRALTESIETIEKTIKEDSTKVEQFETEKQQLVKDNDAYESKISKYDEQKYNAKSNKEYDDIVKSIDGYMELIQKNEARIKEIESQNSVVTKDIEERTTKNEEYKKDLEENKDMLNELNTEFEDEEKELTAKREMLISKLDDETRSLYERINSGSMKGEATAIVRKGNCSGCYNSVPPQREIEIKMAEEIFTCQSCGRILIDESIIPNS
jgi:predicted  nucleic acid-binding Zn-ribbon protein